MYVNARRDDYEASAAARVRARLPLQRLPPSHSASRPPYPTQLAPLMLYFYHFYKQ